MFKKILISLMALGMLGACAKTGIKYQPTSEEQAIMNSINAELDATLSSELDELEAEETEETLVR